MKKLCIALTTLLFASGALAADGLIEICGQKVDSVEVYGLDAVSTMNITTLTNSAVANGTAVQICAVGALPVAILKSRTRNNNVTTKAIMYVPELD